MALPGSAPPAVSPLRGFGGDGAHAIANRTEDPNETHRYSKNRFYIGEVVTSDFLPLISNLVIGVDSTMSVIGLLHLQFLALWYAPVAFQLLCLPC